jgi:hypothetical protein
MFAVHSSRVPHSFKDNEGRRIRTRVVLAVWRRVVRVEGIRLGGANETGRNAFTLFFRTWPLIDDVGFPGVYMIPAAPRRYASSLPQSTPASILLTKQNSLDGKVECLCGVVSVRCLVFPYHEFPKLILSGFHSGIAGFPRLTAKPDTSYVGTVRLPLTEGVVFTLKRMTTSVKCHLVRLIFFVATKSPARKR